MADNQLSTIVYEAQQIEVGNVENHTWPKESKNGLSWTCRFFQKFDNPNYDNDKLVYLEWNSAKNGLPEKFEWDPEELKNIIGFQGYLTANFLNSKRQEPFTVDISDTTSGELVSVRFGKTSECLINTNGYYLTKRVFSYSFSLTPIYKMPLQKLFEPSELTDVVLLVEGTKMDVSKVHLAIHSEFFRSLFFSDFKEKSLKEIPVDDVKYEDFAQLLSIIYPTASRPTDGTAEKLLELADRFLMPGIMLTVEHFLLLESKLHIYTKLLLADKYGLKKLKNKMMAEYNTAAKIKELVKSSQYKNLTNETKITLLESLARFP